MSVTSLAIENKNILIVAAIFLVMAIVGFLVYYYSKKQQIIRTLSKLRKLNAIGSLRQNEFAKITGKALHVHEPLIAPFSKRKCVFYSIQIQQRKQRGKSSHWENIISEEKTQDFFVEKNGEYVIIKPIKSPKNYKSYLVVDKETSSGTFNDASSKFETLLKEYNIKSTGFLGFNKQLRYKEAIIEVGEEITVAGLVKWKTLSEKIEGYSYSKIATLESNAQQKIIITDLPKENFTKRM